MLKAVADVKAADCNALVVFLGNFGPETPETLIAKYFDGPCMFVAAAEGDGDLINGRGDAYCGMLNCSYNLGMRHLKGYIPEYPVGTAADIAKMIADFIPIARAVIGVKNLKIITFGPRPQDFFACNAPIKGLYELGVEIEENSELDLLVSYKAHAGDARIPAVCEDMKQEMGEGQLLRRHARAHGAVRADAARLGRKPQGRAQIRRLRRQVLAGVPGAVRLRAVLCELPPCLAAAFPSPVRSISTAHSVGVHRRVHLEGCRHAPRHQQLRPGQPV